VQELEELVLQAAQAAIPPGLLAALQFGQTQRVQAGASNGSGAQQNSKARGRPLGARRGDLGAGVRLHVVETLRAAAPWQALRKRETALLRQNSADAADATPLGHPRRIEVRREDFHVSRFKQRRETTTIFVVDASGSAALHRLAEAKGAVELLLADCYVRRDRVAMLAFRGKGAELMLPPTRSLVRAKRSLAGMPGGGGTPLAAGVDAALALALASVRRGETPILVLLTDGRANIARDGSPGRERAGADALAAARTVRAAGLTALLLDTSPHPQTVAERLAAEMGAAYLPLPHAGAGTVNRAIRLASARPAR
jgi:magnesium chelatase subunit D